MRYALVVLLLGLGCLLAGCGASPALSLRPLYKIDEKPVAEPRLEGEWIPVALSGSGVHQEKTEHWRITAQDDGCYQGERRKKDPEKPDQQEENEIYRVCLVSFDNKLFFDQQLEKQNVGRQMISPNDLAPDVVALHVPGRLWPQQDLIRLTRLNSGWIKENQPEELRMTRGEYTLFTGSTTELRDIMTQHGEDPKAVGSAWYLCRPSADCSSRVVEDELAHEPNDKDVLTGSAVFYGGVEDYGKMILLANKAAELASPDDASLARDFVGFARLLKRDFPGARSEFAAAQKQDVKPEDRAGDAALIGISFFLEGRYTEAHAAFAGIKEPSDDSQPMLMILNYASLVRMGRGKQAEAFLSEQMADFKGKADQQLLLLRSSGRVNDFSPGNFTDDELMQGDGVLYALVRLAKGDRDSARQALESTVSKTPKWDPAYLGAKIELERMGSVPAATK
jgi:hypothetical protein